MYTCTVLQLYMSNYLVFFHKQYSVCGSDLTSKGKIGSKVKKQNEICAVKSQVNTKYVLCIPKRLFNAYLDYKNKC